MTLCFIIKQGHSAQDGGLSLCQRGTSAKIPMALIEMEAVCERVVLLLGPTFKKDVITSA